METRDDRIEVHIGDALYPRSVLDLPDPPVTLYLRGDPSALVNPGLAIIGARKSTPYGRAIAEMAGRMAAESGIVVVSGAARGCDQAGGRAALDSGGRHVIVLGTGADVVYPASAGALIERSIRQGGCIVSIEPWGTPPMRWAFPKRNRVIAALSRATFVAEAGLPSGTFSTAETADELGRELLAAPGSIFSPESRGANYLICNGACCIADEEALEVAISRIFGTLRFARPDARGFEALDARCRRAMDILLANPMRADELALALGIDSLACLQLLGELEVLGLVDRLVDGRLTPSSVALHSLTRLGQNN